MADGYLLSENDLKLFREVLAKLRRNPRRAFTVPSEEPPSSDVYVIFTPSGGIPARSGTTPGSANCDIYQLITPEDRPTLQAIESFTQPVFNLSTTAIDGSTYLLAKRDKWGSWYAEQAAGGSTTAGVHVAYVPSAGIPAISPAGTGTINETPGQAACDIYEIAAIFGPLVMTGASVLVNNVGGFITGNSWIVVVQDGHGDWYAVSSTAAATEGPEMYIARTPSGGIPALSENRTGTGSTYPSDDVPGSAVCEIFTVSPGGLFMQDEGISVTVYNLNTIALAGNTWVTVQKDYFGTWVAPALGLRFTTC